MHLDISKKKVQDAYALSKSTVISEQDPNQRANYQKINYTEFLEFCARIAEKWFAETEMADLDLHRKIEYFLENLFSTAGVKVAYQERVIDEFSDSDEDY